MLITSVWIKLIALYNNRQMRTRGSMVGMYRIILLCVSFMYSVVRYRKVSIVYIRDILPTHYHSDLKGMDMNIIINNCILLYFWNVFENSLKLLWLVQFVTSCVGKTYWKQFGGFAADAIESPKKVNSFIFPMFLSRVARWSVWFILKCRIRI